MEILVIESFRTLKQKDCIFPYRVGEEKFPQRLEQNCEQGKSEVFPNYFS